MPFNNISHRSYFLHPRFSHYGVVKTLAARESFAHHACSYEICPRTWPAAHRCWGFSYVSIAPGISSAACPFEVVATDNCTSTGGRDNGAGRGGGRAARGAGTLVHTSGDSQPARRHGDTATEGRQARLMSPAHDMCRRPEEGRRGGSEGRWQGGWVAS